MKTISRWIASLELRHRLNKQNLLTYLLYVMSAPVSELRLLTNYSTVTNANITNTVLLFYKSTTFVACDALGGNPAPRIRICLGRTDMTSQFESTVDADGLSSAGERVVRLVSRSWTPSTDEHNGQTLKCVARVQTGHGRPDLRTSVSAIVDVRCKRIYECCDAISSRPCSYDSSAYITAKCSLVACAFYHYN